MKSNQPFILPIQLPKNYHVHDFNKQCKNGQCSSSEFSIGRYNEQRSFYPKDEFGDRVVHLGIDFGAPANTPFYAVSDCEIYYHDSFNDPGDYGGFLVTKNEVNNDDLYCIYGHISKNSLANLSADDFILQGQQLGWIGDFSENGQWPPHLHFQISLNKPMLGSNIPGVFSLAEISKALHIYPDPQIYFGKLY